MAKKTHSGATALATPNLRDGDAEIIAAWKRRNEALAVYNIPRDRDDTPEETVLINLASEQEHIIQVALASTLRGAQIQLWAALENAMVDVADCDATLREDVEYFAVNESKFDWPLRLMISALRSLRAMTEQPLDAVTDIDARDWIDRFQAVGGTVHPASIGVQLYDRPRKDQQAARAMLAELERDAALREQVLAYSRTDADRALFAAERGAA